MPSPKDALHSLFKGLQQRASHIIQVVDDALSSDNLKDRIWAVELLMKRLRPADDDNAKREKAEKKRKLPSSKKINAMTDEELHAAINQLLEDS